MNERKYNIPGPVTKRHDGKPIPPDEPIILFRAQDAMLPELLAHYFRLCKQAGCDQAHLTRIAFRAQEINEWQAANLTKTPDL